MERKEEKRKRESQFSLIMLWPLNKYENENEHDTKKINSNGTNHDQKKIEKRLLIGMPMMATTATTAKSNMRKHMPMSKKRD